MELGREPGGPGREGCIMEAPDILGADMVGIDIEGRDIGGPDTGGPGIKGTDEMDMGGRGIEGCPERADEPETRGLDRTAEGMETVDTVAADTGAGVEICRLAVEYGPGMVGMAGPGGGVCWALTAFETSSSHLSASEGVRLWPLCIATETGGGDWRGGSG